MENANYLLALYYFFLILNNKKCVIQFQDSVIYFILNFTLKKYFGGKHPA